MKDVRWCGLDLFPNDSLLPACQLKFFSYLFSLSDFVKSDCCWEAKFASTLFYGLKLLVKTLDILSFEER